MNTYQKFTPVWTRTAGLAVSLTVMKRGESKAILPLSDQSKFQLLISEGEIDQRISEISEEISSEYEGKELTLICVLKGAIPVTSALMKNLSIDTRLERIRCKSYRGVRREVLTVEIDQNLDLKGKDVLIIDDICDSGSTLYHLTNELKKKSPKSIKTLVLLDKLSARTLDFTPDYSSFTVENKFLVGYGLDCDERYRNLPGVYIYESK